MAIPSGSGTEVLKRHTVKANGSAWTTIRWSEDETAKANTSAGGEAVPTNCIVTILNISVCEQAGSASAFALTKDVAGTADIYILSNGGTTIPANGTFVYSDKIILYPTDKLKVYTQTAAHFHINYIYQDWT